MIDQDELLVCMCLMDRKPTDNIYFTQGGIILCDTCYRIYKDLPLSMMKGDTALGMVGCSVFDVMNILDDYREHFKDGLDMAKHFPYVPSIKAIRDALGDDW